MDNPESSHCVFVIISGFVVTDGQSTDPNSLKASIARLQNTDIEMYAVGK
jgi:hypothetical protein